MKGSEAALRFAMGAAQVAGAVVAISLYRSGGATWGFAAAVIGTSVIAVSSIIRFHTGAWRITGLVVASLAVLASVLLAYAHEKTTVPNELTALDAVVPSDAYALTDVSYDAGRFSVTAMRELDTNMDAHDYDAWVARRLGGGWRRDGSPAPSFVHTTSSDSYSITLEHRDRHVRVIGIARAE